MSGALRLIAELAFRHVERRKRQTLVAISGVAVGVGFFLAVSAMMIGSQNDFIKTLIDSAPHIILSDELRSPPPQPALVAFGQGAVEIRHQKARTEVRGLKDWQAILRAVDATPGATGSPSLTGGVTLRLGGREEAVGLVGVEPGIEAKVSNIEDNLRMGRLRDLETVQGGLIVGEDLAERLGLRVGDVVGATSAAGVLRTLRVVGLFKRGAGQLGASSGYVLLREAQAVLGRPFIVNRIGVKLDDPQRAEAVAAALEKRFGYKAESWQERSADILALLVTRNVIMYSVVSAILLVASFGIYTAVSTSVTDKVRDIAILRSIGFSQADLQLIFALEGAALAVVGILFGWALGYGLMAILGSLDFPINGEPRPLPLDRSARQYAIAAAASLVSGVLAAWLPARKAARVDPVDILRSAT